ncbi:MAG: hypothetical protein JW830_10805 [Bacteroidales bacterium]|nr:hypothetical protein [Bacteroidales bacterium]
MDTEITCLSRALDLPEKWDCAAVDYFQTRDFLNHTEKYNPCNQRYYLLYQNETFKTGVVVYTLKLDLLTYLRIPSPFRMHIAGIPCSVSANGIIGNPDYLHQIIGHIKIREKGMLLFLNLESELVEENMITGKTLPTIIITNPFGTWEDYLLAMRTSYRRRIRQLSIPFSEIQRKQFDCSFFDGRMYDQYLGVLKRSKGKLETLSMEFFQKLPSNFNLTVFYSAEKLIGWYISSTFNKKFYFFLGGLDYKVNRKFNTYFNILINVVKEGIGKSASIIDLGQTAEIPKLRLGGKLVEKTMLGYHSSRIMRKLMKVGKSLLEYSAVVKESQVFKEIQ